MIRTLNKLSGWGMGMLFLFSVVPAAANDKLTLYTTEIPGQTMLDDDLPGTAMEIARKAANRAGLTLDERFMPWPRAVKAVETDNTGVIVPFSRTPSREPRFTWIGIIYNLRFGFVSLDQAVDTKEAARKLDRLGVWRGTSMEEELRREGFNNLVTVPNDQALARMLVGGRFKAWYGSLNEAGYMFRGIKKLNKRRIVFGKPVTRFPVWLGGNRDMDKDTVRRLRAALRSLREDGTIRAVMMRYGMINTLSSLIGLGRPVPS